MSGKCTCMCVCVSDGEGNRVFASTVGRAVYVTSYRDYLTSSREPLSPPYRCHTNYKNV